MEEECLLVRMLMEFDVNMLKWVVFCGSVGSDYGKNLCWWLEKWFGENGKVVLLWN